MVVGVFQKMMKMRWLVLFELMTVRIVAETI
jgi:hypothetical protein